MLGLKGWKHHIVDNTRKTCRQTRRVFDHMISDIETDSTTIVDSGSWVHSLPLSMSNRKKTSGKPSRARVKISHPLAVRSRLYSTVSRVSVIIQQEQNRRPRHSSTSTTLLTPTQTTDEDALQCEHIDDLLSLSNNEEPVNYEQDVTMHDYQIPDANDTLKKPPVS